MAPAIEGESAALSPSPISEEEWPYDESVVDEVLDTTLENFCWPKRDSTYPDR